MSMTDRIEMVREFMDAFQASTDPKLWESLVAEEAGETEDAVVALYKELSDLEYVLCGLFVTSDGAVPSHDITSRLERLDRAVQQLAESTSALRDVAFGIVHHSNMSKLGADGKPIRREDGKVLKGPNYQPAEPTLKVALFGRLSHQFR